MDGADVGFDEGADDTDGADEIEGFDDGVDDHGEFRGSQIGLAFASLPRLFVLK